MEPGFICVCMYIYLFILGVNRVALVFNLMKFLGDFLVLGSLGDNYLAIQV